MEQINAITRKAYNGRNQDALQLMALACGYTDPRWLTFKQAMMLGGAVKKGAKGTPLSYYKTEIDEKTGKKKTRKLSFVVFNAEQTEGCDWNKKVAPFKRSNAKKRRTKKRRTR